MKSYQDNYAATRKAIAQRILNSPIADSASERDRQKMRDAVEGIDEARQWSFLNFEVRRAGTNCELAVDAKVQDRSFGRTKDAEGNEWREYAIACQVNHPCHGSASPATGPPAPPPCWPG
jgi:hypothetical protein